MRNATGSAQMDLAMMGTGGDSRSRRKKEQLDSNAQATDQNHVDDARQRAHTVGTEPPFEMTHEWTPMPQPLVLDRSAAETLFPRNCIQPHNSGIRKIQSRSVLGEKKLIMSTAEASLLRKWSCEVAKRFGNRMVFDLSESCIEDARTNDILMVSPGE